MHGTFKNDVQPETDKRALDAKAKRAARKAREEEFQREFARAKATPVPTLGSLDKTIFC